MNKIQAYLQELSPRERQLLIAMAVLIVIAIVYWGVWKQLTDRVEKLENDLVVQTQTNLKATQSIAQIKAAGLNTRRPSRGSISQVVNRTKGRYNLNISRMQPKSDKLQLWIDEAVFNDLVAWLTELENRHSVSVSVFDVTRSELNGRVKVRRLELEKS